jgi:hypothetical protein
MARFFGKNSERITQNLAGERARYKVNAYQKEADGLDQKPIVDFNFAERTLYGRIDQDLNSVAPNPQFMVSLNNTQNPESGVQLLDFVADMYSDFANNFEKACRLQILDNNDPYLSKINAYRSYEEPEFDYSSYLSTVMDQYNQQFIIRGNREDEIFNLTQYAENLVKYSRALGPETPLTFTGFMAGTQASLFTTGIAVSISNLPFSEDAQKDDFFIQNEAFQYYLNLAKNIGFSVAKNSPWVLVADLASPAIKPYLQKYGIVNVANVFQTRYTQTHLSDVNKMIQGIITSYRQFVNQKPFYKQIKSCGSKTQSELIYRKQVNNNSILELNNNNILIINLYCIIRNIEEREPLNKIDLNKLIKEALNYQKTFDMETAIGYINDRYRETRKFKDGGINSIIRKQNEKKNLTNQAPNDTILGSLFTGR